MVLTLPVINQTYGVMSTEIINGTVQVGIGSSNNTAISTNTTGDVNIPKSVLYNGAVFTVTAIGSHAFSGCQGITGISIPESITILGNRAFYNCTSLQNISFSGNVPSAVGMDVFLNIAPNAALQISEDAIGFDTDDGGKWNGLVVEQEAGIEPQITSISAGSITRLVTNCAANLNIAITGENLDGTQIVINLKQADGTVVYASTPFDAADEYTAKLSFSAAQMNLPAGSYMVEAAIADTEIKVETNLELVAQSPLWWDLTVSRTKYNDLDALEAHFAADIPSRTIGAVLVNNVLYPNAIYKGNSVFITGQIPTDKVTVKIANVRYPEYFPSYSFTFTANEVFEDDMTLR